MFGSSIGRSNGHPAPSQFRDSARNAIFQELPGTQISSATSIRSAPSRYQPQKSIQKSLLSSIFSSGKRSVRSAPSMYSSSTATIPEDSEPITLTVEQLVNDVQLHEKYFYQDKKQRGLDVDIDSDLYKISLGSSLTYQNVPESLIDWNLNVTRCKLILTQLPAVSSVPSLMYSNSSLPQLIGDLAVLCHIVVIQPHITDRELIYTLMSSNIYQEHNLDAAFKKSVAEISVKQSRLLQINSAKQKSSAVPIVSADNQPLLRFEFKEIAIRNFLVNLAAAATTAHEYKIKSNEFKEKLKKENPKGKLTKEFKKKLWNEVRLEVFKRAGLEEN